MLVSYKVVDQQQRIFFGIDSHVGLHQLVQQIDRIDGNVCTGLNTTYTLLW
jgi:hypothetical protein